MPELDPKTYVEVVEVKEGSFVIKDHSNGRLTEIYIPNHEAILGAIYNVERSDLTGDIKKIRYPWENHKLQAIANRLRAG